MHIVLDKYILKIYKVESVLKIKQLSRNQYQRIAVSATVGITFWKKLIIFSLKQKNKASDIKRRKGFDEIFYLKFYVFE